MDSDMLHEIKHQDSHQRLVESAPRRSGTAGGQLLPESRLNAIIVPSSRPAPFLTHAIDLALATNSWIVVFCSGLAKVQEIRQILGSGFPGKAAVVEIPHAYTHPLFEFSTASFDEFKRANLYRVSDLSLKRNLGLALSKMLGWRKVFFLDDDIRDMTADEIHRVAVLLDSYSCAGFSMDYFPDNSVVSHAKRLSFDHHQEIMISGAAMGIRCQSSISFFPDIYNEDLFFILDEIARGAVLHTGSLSQLPYEPFNQPDRAASEEFGEVLMEGFLALLHAKISLSHATDDYWSQFLSVRMRHIESIERELQRKHLPVHEAALLAMRAARVQLSEISSTLCTAYIAEWRADSEKWRRRLRALAPQSSVSEAIRYLNLTQVLVLNETSGNLLRTGNAMHLAAERITIRQLSEDDWTLLRQVRLQALLDSPRAFASSYHIEEGSTEQQWRALIGNQLQWFVAFDKAEPVGVVASRSGPDIPPAERYIESMWVAPRYRGIGVAGKLIKALTETARAAEVHTLWLWVLDGNHIAREVYLKLGFASTGERQPLEAYPNRIEERMKRTIS